MLDAAILRYMPPPFYDYAIFIIPAELISILLYFDYATLIADYCWLASFIYADTPGFRAPYFRHFLRHFRFRH